jgi:hypothetical protein
VIPKNRLPLGVASARFLYSKYRWEAERRKLSFELTIEQFLALTLKDCYICGDPPSSVIRRKNAYGTYTYNGVDRVDNSKGYDLSNCMPCCQPCNLMKKCMPLDVFKNHVLKIARMLNEES